MSLKVLYKAIAYLRLSKEDGDEAESNSIRNQRILIEDYNYVALYKLNNYFYEHYSMLFENPSEISENTLYWVNKSTGQLEKCD